MSVTECLHCGGTGTEPFSDEQCCVCLGEQHIPEKMNREYYDKIKKVIRDA